LGCLSCLHVFRPKFVPSAASNRRPICTGLHVSSIYKSEDSKTKLRLETQAFCYMRSFFLDYPESGDRIPHKRRKLLADTAQYCSCTPLSHHFLISKVLLTRSDTTQSPRAIICQTFGSVSVNVVKSMKQNPKVRYLVDKSQALATVISHMNSARNHHCLP
jgi:hypothetical protein